MATSHRSGPAFAFQQVATAAIFEQLPKGRLGKGDLPSDIGNITAATTTDLIVVTNVTVPSSRTVSVRGSAAISCDIAESLPSVTLSLWQGSTNIGNATTLLSIHANERVTCWVEGDAVGGAGIYTFSLRAQLTHGIGPFTAEGASSGFLKILDDSPAF